MPGSPGSPGSPMRRGAAPEARRIPRGAPRRPERRPRGPIRLVSRHHQRTRVRWIGVVMGLGFAVVAARLVYLQGTSSQRYAAYAVGERLVTRPLHPSRGSLLDRTGHVMEMTVRWPNVTADPHLVTSPARYAAKLAPLLKVSVARLEAQLSSNSGFVYLAHTVAPSVAAKVSAVVAQNHWNGIGFDKEPRTIMANGAMAQPVLGIVGTEGTGLTGLQYQYNKLLAGSPGSVTEEVDPGGGVIPGTRYNKAPAVNGTTLVLTLDRSLQYELEKVLSREITAAHASGGTAVVLDARTGGVLAMASLVAATPGGAVTQAPSNLAVTRAYEPGSVMKLVTLAAALQDHVIVPGQHFIVPNSLTLGGALFHDAEVHPTENLSVAQIIAQSSNVGTIEITERLGRSQLLHYQRLFGLASPSALAFPGESAGVMPTQWSASSIGSVPIGQGNAVTTIQLADAFNTIANGGVFVPPHLVKARTDPSGRFVLQPLAPSHRLVSATTASELTPMLEKVVTQGTGVHAAIPGYTVAGKTGTAQEPYAHAVGYRPGYFDATFAGFVPAQHPAFTAVVTLFHSTPIYGGSVAAPVFRQVMTYALRHFDIPPNGISAPGASVAGRGLSHASLPSAINTSAIQPSANKPSANKPSANKQGP
ncbi:MAG: peptidoglycan D,D-transpeptidase FtsI family protein [Acidimicrobiales bacterium]